MTPNARRPRAARPLTTRLAAAAYGIAACGITAGGTTACGSAGPPAPAAVTVVGAWARPAAAGADGAAYFTLHNTRRDTAVVVGLASPAARAATLHASTTLGQGAGAMVHMTPVPRAAVAPGDSLVLAPNGRHLMLTGLTRALRPGDRVPLVVHLASGDSVRAVVEVRAP